MKHTNPLTKQIINEHIKNNEHTDIDNTNKSQKRQRS